MELGIEDVMCQPHTNQKQDTVALKRSINMDLKEDGVAMTLFEFYMGRT
jgi:hypothetical protein